MTNASSRVPTYGCTELTFEGPDGVPADLCPLKVTFTHDDGDEVTTPGFWDGGSTYRVRFSPERPGRWTWQSASQFDGLDGVAGFLEAGEAQDHGPVRVNERFHFAHADGTSFFPVGTTVYNWLHQEPELYRSTLDAISDGAFNKLRFLVFPQAGDHVARFPTLLPFERDSVGNWDSSRPDIEFFGNLDSAVSGLKERGIQADILIFNAYDKGHFGFDGFTAEQDAIYLRYLVARLAAYSNVWWSLCNEFDLLTDRPRERWGQMGTLLAEIDPYQRLRSIHNWMSLYDHNQPWVTHASIQNGFAPAELGRTQMYRDVYEKPIVLDEIKYEGDTAERWGRLTGRELVHRFWVTTVGGCYASHGESFLKPNDSLHVVEGGPFEGRSPARLKFLREVLDSLVVPGLDPIDKFDDEACVAGVPRQQYLQYLGSSCPSTWTFRLPQGNAGERLQTGDVFEVDLLDTWEMTRTPVPRRFTLTEVRKNDAYAHDDEPVALQAGSSVALLITRVG